MKRRLIKQGGGGVTFYVPKKWVDRMSLKPGDEIDIMEKNDKLVIAPDEINKKSRKIEVDITNYDRSSFLKLYKSLYESGYDEIKFVFTKKQTNDLRTKKKVLISDQIVRYTPRFEGFAIISQSENYYVIKDITKPSEEEFDNVLRRVFFLILQFNDAIRSDLENNSLSEIEKWEQYHDNITIFVGFCLRLLNKKIVPDVNKYNLYHIINLLDLIVDYNMWLCQNMLKVKKLSNASKDLIYRTFDIFNEFHKFFYKSNPSNIRKLVDMRFSLKRDIFNAKIPHKEKAIVTKYSSVFEIVNNLIKCVLALGLSKS